LYGRFIGLYDSLDKESFKFYITCLNYLVNISSFGYPVPTGEMEELHYQPLIRVTDFMRQYFEGNITGEEY
jgi:hypothetical protein